MPKRKSPQDADPTQGNGLKPPASLAPDEQKLWNEVVLVEPGLRPADAIMAFTWLRLACAYVRNPDGTTLNAVRLMNQLGGRLGFSPSQRKRLGLKALRAIRATRTETKRRLRYNFFNDPDWQPPDETNGA